MTRKELGKTVFENLTWEKIWETDIQRVLDSGKIDKNGGTRLGSGKGKGKDSKICSVRGDLLFGQ